MADRRRGNSARPGALCQSVIPGPQVPQPTARASTPVAVPTLPHSATPVATPHSPHTELRALPAVTLPPHTRPDRAVRPPARARPWTTHPRRCDASSPAARAPLHSAATVAAALVVPPPNQREDMPLPQPDVGPRAPPQRRRNPSGR